MITINIPGWANLEIENMIIDLNGTLATDGKISQEIKEKINILSKQVNIYILTSDTQATAIEELKGINAKLVEIEGEGSEKGKFEFIKSLDPERTVAIGNGNNDQLILKEAALGIAVLGNEGVSVASIKNADVVVKDISDCLDLFLKPKRLVATLRE